MKVYLSQHSFTCTGKGNELFESDIQQVKLDGKKETKGRNQYAKGITLKDVTQKGIPF